MDFDPRELSIRQTATQVALSLVLSGKFHENEFHDLVNKVSDVIISRKNKVVLRERTLCV